MTPREKDALGRAILRELPSVERYLHMCRALPNDVPDIALDAALITWRKVARGVLVLPDDPGERGGILRAYMRRIARHRLSDRRFAGDIMLRAVREDDVEPERVIGYTIDAVIEVASELRAQPPGARRFLVALLEVGSICDTARALRMSRAAANDAMSRAREHATGKRRPPRGKNRPKPTKP